MKTLVNLVILAAAMGAGLLAGSAWKRHIASRVASQSIAAPGETNANLSAATPSHKKASSHRSDDSPLATQLERELGSSSGVTNWLCWMGAMEKAQPGDFPRLLRLARGHPAAWKILANRWAEIAPREMFDSLVAASKSGSDLPISELGRTLFDKWVKQDPGAAVAALNEPGAVGLRDSWRWDVASAMVEKDAERGLELMSDWHIEHYGPRMDAVEKWAAADPRHAAEFAMAHPAGYASQLAIETVAKAWASTDPGAVLAFAASKTGDLATRLGTTALKTWAAKDLSAAADWLTGTDEATRNRLSGAFLQTWASQDASAALSWSENNLDGTRLNQAVTAVVQGAADKDVAAAAEMVNQLEPGAARTQAAAIVAQRWFPNSINNEPLKPELLKWISGLDPDSVRSVLNQSCWNWANSDPQSMAKFLAAAPSEEVPPFIDSILGRTLARSHPDEAQQWAASLPPNRALDAGGAAFADWHQSQPDAAAAWLNALPKDDPRRFPFFQQMIQSIAYSSQAAEQLAALSATDKSTAQGILANMSLAPDQRTRLLDAVKSN